MSNYESRLKTVRQKAQAAEREKVQYETRKEEALKRKAELEEKCTSLGINPANIGEEVKKTEQEVEAILEKVEGFFPDNEDSDTF